MGIKLFGAKAQSIVPGQQFIATVTYVEGHKVVELKEIPKIYSDEVDEAFDREMETRSDDY